MRCLPALKSCDSSSPLRRFPPNRQRMANLPTAVAVECWVSGNPLLEPGGFHWQQPPSRGSGLLRDPARGRSIVLAEPIGCWVRSLSQGSGLQGTVRRGSWLLFRSCYIPLRIPQPLPLLRSAAVAESFWYGWVRDPHPISSRFLIQPAKIS